MQIAEFKHILFKLSHKKLLRWSLQTFEKINKSIEQNPWNPWNGTKVNWNSNLRFSMITNTDTEIFWHVIFEAFIVLAAIEVEGEQTDMRTRLLQWLPLFCDINVMWELKIRHS